MKVIKALICLVFATYAFIFPAAGALTASAEEGEAEIKTYAYADIGDSCWFFSEKNEKSALFMIPQTYCVQILGEDGDWYKVQYAEDAGIYQALQGYCLKSDLTLLEKPLENLYLHMPVTIIYRTDSSTNLLPSLGDIEITAAYYGAYSFGKTACSYVLANGKFGYITGAIEDYPLNELPTRPTVAPAENKNSNVTLITAIAITTVAAAAIIILYFASKKPKTLPQPKQ